MTRRPGSISALTRICNLTAFLICVVSLLGGGAPAAGQGSEFEFNVDGVLPSSQGAIYYLGIGASVPESSVYSVSGGLLHQATLGTGAAAYYVSPKVFDHHLDAVLEWRCKVSHASGDAGVYVALHDPDPANYRAWNFYLLDDRIKEEAAPHAYALLDTTDAFHTYKLVIPADSDTYQLYVDGILKLTGTAAVVGDTTYPWRGQFIWGDATGGNDGSVDWDYIKLSQLPSDGTSPTTAASLSGPEGTNAWYTGDVTVTLTSTDTDVANTYYTVDGGATQTYSIPFTVSGDLVHSVTYWSVDTSGNAEAANPLTIQIDGTAPTAIFGPPSPAPNGEGWNNTTVDLPFTPSDALSGVLSYSPESPLTFTTEGAGQTQSVTVTDTAGNEATIESPEVNIDLTDPFTLASLLGPTGNHGWFRGPVAIALDGSDNLSGLATTSYTLDGGSTTTYAGAFAVFTDGTHAVTHWSTDAADNVEAANALPLFIDSVAPTLAVTLNKTILPKNKLLKPVIVTASTSDGTSGIDVTYAVWQVKDSYGTYQPSGTFNLGGAGATKTGSKTINLDTTLNVGSTQRVYTITIYVMDMAGNLKKKAVTVTVK